MSNDLTPDDDRLAQVIAFPGAWARHADPDGKGAASANRGAASNDTAPEAAPDKAEQLARLRAHIASVEQGEPEPDRAAEAEPEHPVAAPAAARAEPDARLARRSNVTSLRPGPSFVPADDADADEPGSAVDAAPPLTPEAAIADGVERLTRLLARSPKSAQECDAHLRANTELDEAQRGEVLDRLRSYGYLDDERLAEQLVTGKLARKGLGRAGMARELRQRGLESDVIDDALESADTSDFDLALELATKRARSLRDLDPEVARRRLYGYLGRRGFSGSVVSQVVHLALQPPKSSGPYFK